MNNQSGLWAVLPKALDGLMQSLALFGFMKKDEQPKQEALIGVDLNPIQRMESYLSMHDSVAVIHLEGTIHARANFFTRYMGGVSLEQAAKDLKAALNDPKVKGILLHIDSPGGDVSGVTEFAELVNEGQRIKPIHGFTGGFAASAAYWIISPCAKIGCTETSALGSIGILYRAVDYSGWESSLGIESTTIVSSQSPKKAASPFDKEGKKLFQELADDQAQSFINQVAHYRGVTSETVQNDFGQGFLKVGADAVKLGMADEVTTFEAMLMELQTSKSGDTDSSAQTTTIKPEALMTDKKNEKTDTPEIPVESGEPKAETEASAEQTQPEEARTLSDAQALIKAQGEKLAKLESAEKDLQAKISGLEKKVEAIGSEANEPEIPKSEGLESEAFAPGW
ncbi:MAG: S49 family peptidase [Deltaproteobacteria bacterium]|nr:S49 family peptidase [Deltaproteobacteria bacterium]